jgi:hypothetical protein
MSLAGASGQARVPMSQTRPCEECHEPESTHACVVKYIRAWLLSQAPRGWLASRTRTCVGTLMKLLTDKRLAACQHEASCHLLAAELWLRFIAKVRAVVMMGQTLKCECWRYEGLDMYHLLCMSNVHSIVRIKFCASVHLSPYFFETYITKFLVGFWATPLLLIMSRT